MKRLAKLSVIALLLTAAGAASAQESAPANLRRTIPVAVLDGQGKPVGGLTPQNLQGEFRGQPVRVLSVKWDAQPRRIVVLLDASSSMMWGERWTWARKGAEDILLYTRPDDEVAVIIFSDRILHRVEFAQGRQAVVGLLSSLPTDLSKAKNFEGRTALLDSVMEGLRLLNPARSGDLLYIISDGGDNASKLTIDKIKKALACAGVRTFFLLLFDPDRVGRGPEYRLGPYLGDELAELTGGRSASVPLFADRTVVGAAARSLYGEMKEFYAVEIELSRPIDKQRRWSLKVVDEQGKRMRGTTVVYPQQLAPCSIRPASAQ